MSIATEITRLQNAKADIKTSIENKGVTVPSATKLDGYSTLIDSIQTGITPSGTLSVSQNGTYDVTSYASASVNVSGGMNYQDLKPVAIIDYDGNLLHNYDVDEFLALNSLPANPSHSGLVAQGWNWSLADAKTFVQNNGCICIGQNYTTDDGKTRLYMDIDEFTVGADVSLSVNLDPAGEVVVDFGDGSSTVTLTGNGNKSASHTYNTIGKYVMTFTVVSGKLRLGYWGSNSSIFLANTSAHRKACASVKKIEVGNDCIGFTRIACTYFFNMESVSLPVSATMIGESSTSGCFGNTSLHGLVLPPSVELFGTAGLTTNASVVFVSFPSTPVHVCLGISSNLRMLTANVADFGQNACSNAYRLQYVAIPGEYTTIPQYTISNTNTTGELVVPATVTTINDYGLNNYHGTVRMKPTTPPTMSNKRAIESVDTIYVPYSADHSILNAYQTATNWSQIATKIVEESQ